MDRETMRRLVAPAPVGRFATVRSDGRPHVVPICFVLTDEIVYSAVDDKPKRHRRLQRIRNFKATGTASLLVDEYNDDWSRLWWVRLDGKARLVDNTAEAERATTLLSDKYPQYGNRPPPGPVLAIDVQGWVGWSAASSEDHPAR
jgi:PPOX class probable F420-dependent enzyme